MSNDQIRDFVVLGIDINSYSTKDLRDQNAAQRRVDQFFADALAQDGLAGQNAKWLDTGDGGYLLFEGPATAALTVIEHFFRLLNEHNGEVIAERKIDIRMALHYGQVICWTGKLGVKYTSDTINNCSRLLAGMRRDRCGQVICSGSFKEHINVLAQQATVTRLRDVKDKHGGLHAVYNLCRRPGFGVEPTDQEMHENPLVRIVK